MNADASLFQENTISGTLPASSAPQIISEVSNSLSSDDIKKLCFLCIDFISTGYQFPQTIMELESLISNEIDFVALLKELLYHIKKYRLLKSLQTCKHQMEVQLHNAKYVKQERLSLFNVCENIENGAVDQLKILLGEDSTVSEGWEDLAAEDFFRIWLSELEVDKMFRLKEALLKMNRNKLAEDLVCEESYKVITPLKGKPCGLAVIFNNEIFNKPTTQTCGKRRPSLEKREGTHVDQENLCKLWSMFGFDVVVFNDATYSSMVQILKLLTELDYTNYSIFVCCLLTHGDKGVIYTSDNIPVNFEKIMYSFNSSDVPSLRGKPKMFFIQACQGSGVEILEPAPTSNLEMDSVGFTATTSNNKRDMLWMSSAIPSHMSYRDTKNGSWFVNSLVEIFERDGTKKPVQKLLNSVADDVSRKSGLYGNVGIVTQMPASSVTTFLDLRLKRLEDNTELSQRIVRLPQQCSAILLPLFWHCNVMYRV